MSNSLLKNNIPGRRAVITGFGLVTPFGSDKAEVWGKLLTKQSSARNWDDLEKEGFRFTKACRIEDKGNVSPLKRGRWLALTALRDALSGIENHIPEITPVFIGSTIGESGAFEAIASGTELNPREHTIDSFANAIRGELGLNGMAFSYGTACAAGNYALGAASTAICNGMTDVAIAGGVEPFSRVAMTGFSRSRAMTSDHCRPFDQHRNGMILGEGAAIFVLEEESHALARNATPLAVVGSLGLSCDAYHPTAPLENGSGIQQAITKALSLEKIEPHAVDWICAHGSGTFVSDRGEAAAILECFGVDVPVSGIKGALGHALGAATAIEAAVCIMALLNDTIPPTTNLENPDPEFKINLVTNPLERKINFVLNCGYAFGGLNSALLLKKWK